MLQRSLLNMSALRCIWVTLNVTEHPWKYRQLHIKFLPHRFLTVSSFYAAKTGVLPPFPTASLCVFPQVCEEARCPNIGECWGGGEYSTATATIMVSLCHTVDLLHAITADMNFSLSFIPVCMNIFVEHTLTASPLRWRH